MKWESNSGAFELQLKKEELLLDRQFLITRKGLEKAYDKLKNLGSFGNTLLPVKKSKSELL